MLGIKRYTIFAGVNGAGKSTLFGVYNSEDLGVRLNTDEMVKDAGKDWKDNAAQVEAGKKLIKLQQECRRFQSDQQIYLNQFHLLHKNHKLP